MVNSFHHYKLYIDLPIKAKQIIQTIYFFFIEEISSIIIIIIIILLFAYFLY